MRVVLLGLGAVTDKILIPAIHATHGLEIVGACDTSAAVRERAARAGAIAASTIFETPREAIEATRPALVVVATPPDSHRELSILALQAGAHVFCEKPFAPSVADADAILAAAKRAQCQVAINNQYYKMPIFAALRDEVASGRRGDLLFLSAWQTTLEPPSRDMGWRGALRKRTLYEFGTHAVDLIMHTFGERPSAVTCAIASDGGEREWDAVAAVTLHFSRGRIATLTTNRVSRGRWRYLDFRADCRDATLRASLGGEARIAFGVDGLARVPFVSPQITKGGFAWIEKGERRRVIARNPANPYAAASALHLGEFVRAIADGQPFDRGAAVNRAAIETVAAAYLSAELGRRVDLTADAPAIAAVTLG
jgi:predicted dehydrogenase